MAGWRQAFGAVSLLGLAGCAGVGTAPSPNALDVPQSNDPYFEAAAGLLRDRAGTLIAEPHARNIILFVGDGMGVATVTAARIYAGQQAGVDGESHQLALDQFPHTALSRTYSHDFQVSDSAATATAMTTGVKTRSGVVGLTSAVARGQCAVSADASTNTLFELAEMRGLATGVVSTARITHATPASAYAHSANRNWENAAGGACVDIARQLVEWPAGDGLELALGGGRENFLPLSAADPEDEGATGAREDERDLTAEWVARSPDHAFVWNADAFAALDPADGPKVLGLFERSHLEYEADRAEDAGGEPSLAELTAFAIDRLSQDGDGFVLLVEGGRIDHAHHAGNAARALADTVAFDDAVRTALERTDRADTLILVTADHSHTLTIAGYSARNAPILGLAQSAIGEPIRGADGRPYSTLGYVNGPGAVFAPTGAAEGARPDLADVAVEAVDYRQQALVPLPSESHAGEDVAIYAWGPYDALIAGTVEQNYIFHALAYALDL